MVEHLLVLGAKAILVWLMVLITTAASYVLIRAIRKSDADSGPGGFAWQAMLFAVMMSLFLGAALGIPACRDMVVNGWGAIIGVCAALFGGWLAYKGYTKDAVAVSAGSPDGPVSVTVTPGASAGVKVSDGAPPQEGL